MAFDASLAEHEVLVHRLYEIITNMPPTPGNVFAIVNALADITASVLLQCEFMKLNGAWALFRERLRETGTQMRSVAEQKRCGM